MFALAFGALALGLFVFSAEKAGPPVRYKVTNEGEDGPLDFWQAWVDGSELTEQGVVKWGGVDEFPSAAAAKAAAIAWIQSVGGTPVAA